MSKVNFAIWLIVCAISYSCSGNSQQAEELEALLLKTNQELFNEGNLDLVDEVFSSDYNGQGPDNLKSFLADLLEAFPDLEVTIDPILSQGNMAGWRRLHRGTFTKALLGYPPTGKVMEWTSVILSRYESGKVVQEWGQSDLFEVLEQQAGESYQTEDIITAAKGAIAALNRGDADAYGDFLHKDFSYFLIQSPDLQQGFDPTTLKEGFGKGMQFSMTLDDVQVKFYGDTAICTGYENGEARMVNGRVISGKRKYTSVWVRQDGQWKEVHLHISKVDS